MQSKYHMFLVFNDYRSKVNLQPIRGVHSHFLVLCLIHQVASAIAEVINCVLIVCTKVYQAKDLHYEYIVHTIAVCIAISCRIAKAVMQ